MIKKKKKNNAKEINNSLQKERKEGLVFQKKKNKIKIK